jgi:hypothetical protein
MKRCLHGAMRKADYVGMRYPSWRLWPRLCLPHAWLSCWLTRKA